MNDVIFKKSRIHGKGVFAARDFKKGEVVISWSTHAELSKEEAERLSEGKQNISYIKGKYTQVPPEGRVNHSCNPNVYLDRNFHYIAKKDIRKNEEVVADYRKESEPGFEMVCRCGSKNCRRLIKV